MNVVRHNNVPNELERILNTSFLKRINEQRTYVITSKYGQAAERNTGDVVNQILFLRFEQMHFDDYSADKSAV